MRNLRQTLLLHLRSRHVVSSIARTTADSEVGVIHRCSIVEEVLLPVRVGTVEFVFRILVGRDDTVFELELQEFVRVHRVTDTASQLAPTYGLTYRDLCFFVSASFLGGNVNYTVGST